MNFVLSDPLSKKNLRKRIEKFITELILVFARRSNISTNKKKNFKYFKFFNEIFKNVNIFFFHVRL